MLEYFAHFEKEADGGYVVTFPDVGPAITQGDNEEEALSMAVEVLELALDYMIREGQPLPAARVRRGKDYRAIRLPGLMAIKVELYNAFLKAKITKAELARRLKIPRMNVDRLFKLSHQSRLDQIEAALGAIGEELQVTVRRATTPRRRVVSRIEGKTRGKKHPGQARR